MDVYYDAIETFTSSLPASADAGVFSVFYFTSESFMIAPLSGPDVTAEQLKEFLAPLVDKLEESNISYTSHFEDFDSYVEFYDAMFAPIPVVSLLLYRSMRNATLTDERLGRNIVRRSFHPQKRFHKQPRWPYIRLP